MSSVIEFLCPKCRSEILLPRCHICGHRVLQINSIYQFCDDPEMKLEGKNQYIGYDSIGEDFDPTVTYWDANNVERYGVYEACGDLIVENFGRDITVLDLGAGLGTASIPLAKQGILTVAADISNVMLSTAAKRANGRFDNLVLARMNAYELMLSDKSVDIVVENAMFHLVDNPLQVVKEIARVLKPGGKLIRYGTYGKPLSENEAEQNRYCNSVLSDISDRYYEYLADHNAESVWFDNHHQEITADFFEAPYNIVSENFTEVFVDKLKFRLHRLRTGAHSDLQHIPKDLLDSAWRYTDNYARNKYGEDYIEIKGFSRYGACLDVYTLRGENAK